jgi:lipopolysaccharide export LptBFGC system permease protein LptF
MMKTRIAVMALALSFMAAGACFAANPHLGTWKLNEAKSKLAPGMGKSTMVTYTDEKDKIKVTVDGVDKDGKPTHGVWVGKFDGKAYPAKGNMSWNSAAYKEINDRTNEITTMKDGKTVWSGKIAVAADGKSRTVTINGTDEQGKKFKSTAVYDKE